MKLTALVLWVLATLFGLAPLAFAQDQSEEEKPGSGSISGTVCDASGVPLAGASVTVIHADTNLGQSAETDSQGQYSITGLTAGTYSVSASADGFKQSHRDAVDLGEGESLRVDASLEPDVPEDSDHGDLANERSALASPDV